MFNVFVISFELTGLWIFACFVCEPNLFLLKNKLIVAGDEVKDGNI